MTLRHDRFGIDAADDDAREVRCARDHDLAVDDGRCGHDPRKSADTIDRRFVVAPRRLARRVDDDVGVVAEDLSFEVVTEPAHDADDAGLRAGAHGDAAYRQHADDREKPALVRADVPSRDERDERLPLEAVEQPRNERRERGDDEEHPAEHGACSNEHVLQRPRRPVEDGEPQDPRRQADEDHPEDTSRPLDDCATRAVREKIRADAPREEGLDGQEQRRARDEDWEGGEGHWASGRSRGKRMTSRMEAALVNIITSRSIPSPKPAVGGIPCSRART